MQKSIRKIDKLIVFCSILPTYLVWFNKLVKENAKLVASFIKDWLHDTFLTILNVTAG